MRHTRLVVRSALLAIVVVACVDKVLGPANRSPVVRVQFNASLTSQTAFAAQFLDMRVGYLRSTGERVAMMEHQAPVTGTSQEISILVDLAACLADQNRSGPLILCDLLVAIVVRDSNLVALDSIEVGPLHAAPLGAIEPVIVNLTTTRATKLAFTGQPSRTVLGTPIAPVVQVTVQNAQGSTITSSTASVTLALGANPSGATLGGSTTAAAVAGVATFPGLTLDRVATGYTLVATSTGLAAATSGAFDIDAVAAQRLEFGAYPAGATAGSAITPITVIARDAQNATVTGFTGVVTLVLVESPPGAVIAGQTTRNAVAGVATFDNVRLNLAGAYRFGANALGLSVATGAQFTVVAGQAATIALASGNAQTATQGAQLPQPIVVRVADANGNAVAGTTVAFAIATGGGSVGAPTAVTNAAGLAQTVWQLGGSPGTQTATASVAGLAGSPVTFSATSVAPLPTQLGIRTQPGGAASGIDFAQQPVVEIRDAAATLVPGSTAAVTAAIATGSGTLTGTTTVSAVNGVATFTNLRITGTGAHTLNFTSPGLTSVTSASIILGQVATQLAITTQPDGAVSGSALATQPVVQVRDAAGNVVTGSTAAVTASIASGTGALTGTTTVNAVNGVATFTNLVITGSGPHTLRFTSAGLSIPTSAGFAVDQTASQLAITTQPAGAVSGVAFATQPVLEVRDATGAVVSTLTVSVTATLTSGTGTLLGTVTVSAVAGVATFTNLRIDVTGNKQLTFTAAGLSSAVTPSFAVAPGAATQLAITTQPGGAAPGAPFVTQPVVQVRDAAGNVVTGSTAPVTATLSTGTGPLLGTTTVSAVAGVATFTDLRIDVTGNKQLTFSATGLTSAVSSTFAVAAGVASQLAITTQPGGATSGAAFGTQPVVQVRDASGNLVTGATDAVTATITTGTGTLLGTATVSAVAGVATFTNLRIDVSGNKQLTFSATSLTSAVSSTFAVAAGSATQLAITTQPGGAAPGAPFVTQPVVQVRDAAGNVVTGATDAVTATLTTGTGTLLGTTTVSAVAGVATFTNLRIDVTGNKQLTFSATGLTSAVSSTFTVASGVASQLAIVTQSAGATSGAPFGTQPVVQVRDASGNLVTGATDAVTATITTGTGTLLGTVTVSAVAGVATFTNLRIDVSGDKQLTFSATGLTSAVSATFTVAPGTASQLAIATQPAGAVSGTAFGTQPVVQVRDAAGNVVTGSSASVTATLTTGTGTLLGTATVSAVAGVATFTNLRIDVSGDKQLTFSATGLTSAVSSTFTVAPGSATQLAIGTQPGGATSGAPFGTQPVVQVRDAAGNVVTGSAASVTATITTGTGTLLGTTTVSAVAGVATFTNLRIDVSGDKQLTFTATGLSNAVSATFTVAPGTASQLAIATQPSGATSGAAFGTHPVVQVRDAAGNVVTGSTASVTATLTTGTGTLLGTATVSAVAGVATFTTLRIDLVGDKQLTFTATGLANAVSSTFTVAPGTASLLAFTVQPSDATAGVAIAPPIQVTARDAAGNTATGFTGNVTLAIGANPGGSTLGGTLTVAAAAGVAAFSNISLNNAGAGYTLTANASGVTGATSATFTISAVSSVNAWISAADGLWSNGANWSKGRAPLTADSVVIALAGTYTVTLDTDFTASTINVGGSSGTQTLSTPLGTLTVNGVLRVSGTGALIASSMTIAGAGTIVNQATITIFGCTVNVPITNQGMLVLEGFTSVNGALTTAVGSILRIQGETNFTPANVTVAAGFTNNGTIELTRTSTSNSVAQLNVTTGTLTNAPSAFITSFGNGGSYFLVSNLDNRGTIIVSRQLNLSGNAFSNSGAINVSGEDLTIFQTGTTPSFTNTGTVTVAAGRTLTMTDGSFIHQTGATLNGGGTLSMNTMTSATFNAAYTLTALSLNTVVSATFAAAQSTSGVAWTIAGGTTLNAPSFTNVTGETLTISASTINAPLANQGTLILQGNTTLNGALTTGAGTTLRVQGDGAFWGPATATVASGFTNNGTIELTSVLAAQAAFLTVSSGALVNPAGRTVSVLTGAGGARQYTGTLDSQGTITVSQPLTFEERGASTNSGTITVSSADMTMNYAGATPSFTNTGTFTINAGRTVTLSGAGVGSFIQQTGGTLNGGGALTVGVPSATFNTAFTLGTLTLNNAAASFATAQTTAGMTWSISGGSVTAPSFTNPIGETLTIIGATMNTPLTNSGTLVLKGTTNLNGTLTTGSGSTLRVEGGGPFGSADATVANGFTNNGTIELTDTDLVNAALRVTAGTLVNAVGRTISVLVGAGGARQLMGALDNQGTITLNQNLTFDQRDATTNSGTISVSGGNLTINQSGASPSFTNTGTLTVTTGRTVTVNGANVGSLTHQTGATLDGGGAVTLNSVPTATFNAGLTLGTVTLNSSTAAFNGAFTVTALSLSSSNVSFTTAQSTAGMTWTVTGTTINGPSFTNSTGVTLTLTGGTINAPLTNNGTLVLHGTVALNGALTTAVGSTLRVESGSEILQTDANIANGFTNNGTIEITGDAFHLSQLNVATGTLVNAVGATINVLDGDLGGRAINAQLDNQGTLNLSPGTADPFSMVGSLTTSGVINMQLGGTTAGTGYDQIGVVLGATLGGTLNVTLINGFTPTSGQTFTILTTPGTVTGTFATLNLPGGITAQYNSNSVVLIVP